MPCKFPCNVVLCHPMQWLRIEDRWMRITLQCNETQSLIKPIWTAGFSKNYSTDCLDLLWQVEAVIRWYKFPKYSVCLTGGPVWEIIGWFLAFGQMGWWGRWSMCPLAIDDRSSSKKGHNPLLLNALVLHCNPINCRLCRRNQLSGWQQFPELVGMFLWHQKMFTPQLHHQITWPFNHNQLAELKT